MSTNANNNTQKSQSGFELVLEVWGWIQIFISPFLLSVLIAGFIYLSEPTKGRLILSIIITIIGSVLGAVMATKAWKGKGTMHFVSRVSASPELDEKMEDK